MSFFTTVAADAKDVETEVVDGLRAALNYVDNVVVTDLEPELVSAFSAALKLFEQDVLAGLIAALKPGASGA